MATEKRNLGEVLEKAVGEYNEFRSPEATARILVVKAKWFEIEFTGSFCRSCGFYDYFDDLRILLEDAGIAAGIAEVRDIERGAEVKFEISGRPQGE